jgi:hypothetical protein
MSTVVLASLKRSASRWYSPRYKGKYTQGYRNNDAEASMGARLQQFGFPVGIAAEQKLRVPSAT